MMLLAVYRFGEVVSLLVLAARIIVMAQMSITFQVAM